VRSAVPTTSHDDGGLIRRHHGLVTNMDTRAHLVVRRPSGGWRDRARRYRIDVDGVPIGKLARDGELAVSVAPGLHTLRARIDWTGSNDVEVTAVAGQTSVLVVKPAGNVLQVHQSVGRQRYLILSLASSA